MSALDNARLDQCIKHFEETFLSTDDKFYHECVAKEATEELSRLKNQNVELERGYELIAERNRELKAEREWQPMSTAPKNRTRILLLIRVFGGYKITIGWRSNNDIQWETEDGVYAHAQTFENMLEGWHPLPEPPEEL